MLLDTLGDQIRLWNDTSWLIHSGNQWFIRSKYSGRVFYPGMVSVNKIHESQKDEFYLVENKNGFGILSSHSGSFINISFTDILDIGTENCPVYFAEKYIPEAELYIIIYYSNSGEVIRKQVFTSGEYSNIYCR